MANPPLQPGAPDNLAVHSGALDKPGTVQVRLLTCKADAVMPLQCLSSSGMYVSDCMVEMTVNVVRQQHMLHLGLHSVGFSVDS